MKFDIKEIIHLLPHSYPFLLVDRVLECDPANNLKALKNVTINESFFVGHFPGSPVMPGVLIIESMAQACAICALSAIDQEQRRKHLVYFMSIENAKFRKPVIPGDSLLLDVHVLQKRKNVCKFACSASVDGVLVSEAVIMAMIADSGKELA